MFNSGFTAIGFAATFVILISVSTCQADSNSQLVNALVNGIAANNHNGNTNSIQESDRLTAEESQTITVIMNTLLPSMFGLFSNITSDDYKANFKEPCRFDVLMDLFKQLPPYFDVIAQKYPDQPDLIAYYSMQLASTFLVNNGSLTMECMYNMLSLQTRLNNFSLDIMDNPEKNPKLVGLFGIFMKPIMKMLKKNAMMKIIEHVDRYEKNDDRENVTIFHILNFLFIVFGVVAILSNILLVILLRRSSIATRWVPESKKKQSQQTTRLDGKLLHPNTSIQHHTHSLKINRNLKGSHGMEHTIMIGSIDRKSAKSGQHQIIHEVGTKASLLAESTVSKNSRVSNQQQISTPGRITTLQRKPKKPLTALQRKQNKLIEEYKLTKATNSQMYYYMRKRYKTRLIFILIAICHSLYIFINFIVMSQASLAAVSLKGLSQFNMACKFAFFLFPPTTAYNILHQFAIWLLVYAIRQHGLKIRRTRTFDPHADADHDLDLINSDSEESSSCNYAKPNTIMDISSHTEEDEDTVSVSLTNNSNNLMISQSGTNCTMPQVTNNSAVKFKSNQSIGKQNGGTNYHQIGMRNLNPIIPYSQPLVQMHQNHPYKVRQQGESCLCELFSRKRNNAMFCIILFIMLCVYDGQNLFLYSLAKLEGKTSTVYFCAFESAYANYYTVLTQFIVPMTNLCLFSLFPILLCTMQVLFDACFLVRVQREQMKRYEKLKEVIEWPLYCYYMVLILSQVPFAVHQIVDLCIGTTKFPFVFPIFIQLKFTSKVWLSIFEMVSMFMACGADLYIWIFCDRQVSTLASNWLSKRMFCRTYKQKKLLTERLEITREQTNKNSSSPMSHSSNNSRTSEVDSSSSSSTYSSNDSNANFKNAKKQKNIYMKPDNSLKSQPVQQQQNLQAQQHSPTQKSYCASTVSSMASGSSSINKKQISPIIAAAADTAAATAKAAAAISASIAPMSIYDNFNNKNSNEDLQENPTSPTFSNDTVPVSAATPLTAPPRIKMIDTDIDEIEDIDLDIGPNDQLSRLYEEKDHELPPPSFNTAVRKGSASNSYRYQYQNDMDLEALVKR